MGEATNGVDVRRLSISAQMAVQITALLIIAIASSVATFIIWQSNTASRIEVLEAWQRRTSSNHYAFRYSDIWAFCQVAENLNPGWVCPNIYAIPTSAGDPPIFPPQVVNRQAKRDLR